MAIAENPRRKVFPFSIINRRSLLFPPLCDLAPLRAVQLQDTGVPRSMSGAAYSCVRVRYEWRRLACGMGWAQELEQGNGLNEFLAFHGSVFASLNVKRRSRSPIVFLTGFNFFRIEAFSTLNLQLCVRMYMSTIRTFHGRYRASKPLPNRPTIGCPWQPFRRPNENFEPVQNPFHKAP